MRFIKTAGIASMIAGSLLATGAATSASASIDSNTASPSAVAQAPASDRNSHTSASAVVRDTILADYTSAGTTWGLNAKYLEQTSADHFEIPAGHSWVITTMLAPGFYDYGNPGAIPIQLRLFTDKATKGFHSPGRQFAQFDSYSSPISADFTFDLSSKRIELKAGTYWFSVSSTSGTNYWWYHLMRQIPDAAPLVVAPISSPSKWKFVPNATDVTGHNLMIVIGGTDKY